MKSCKFGGDQVWRKVCFPWRRIQIPQNVKDNLHMCISGIMHGLIRQANWIGYIWSIVGKWVFQPTSDISAYQLRLQFHSAICGCFQWAILLVCNLSYQFSSRGQNILPLRKKDSSFWASTSNPNKFAVFQDPFCHLLSLLCHQL